MNQLVGKDKDGNTLLLLVLEPGNIFRLTTKRQPIEIRIEDWFPDGIPTKLKLGIFYSETPLADAHEFAKTTKMSFDERTPASAKMRPHCPGCASTIEQLGVWRNESPMAITFCVNCGHPFGMVPQEVARMLNNLATPQSTVGRDPEPSILGEGS